MRPPETREAAIIYECGLQPVRYLVHWERYPFLRIVDRINGQRITLDVERKMIAHDGHCLKGETYEHEDK